MEETGLRMGERRRSFTAVTEIIFNVERCEESG